MRMESFSSIENAISSKNKESEYLNHNFLNNESVNSEDIDNPKSKEDSVCDNHINITYEGLKQKEKTSDESSNGESNSTLHNEEILKTNSNLETNGDVNSIEIPESNSISVDISLDISEKENDIIALSDSSDENRVTKESQNGMNSADVSGDDDLSSVTDRSEVTEIVDNELPENPKTPEVVEILHSSESSSVDVPDNISNPIDTVVLDDSTQEVPANSSSIDKNSDTMEAMEVDDQPVSSEEQDEKSEASQEKSDEVEKTANCIENSSSDTAETDLTEPAEKTSEKQSSEDNPDVEKDLVINDTVELNNTEVLHVDEHEVESVEVMETNENDPFDQVTQNSAEVEQMEVDRTKETESTIQISENNLIEESNVSISKEKTISRQKRSSEDSSVITFNKDDEEHCIIPDEVNESAKAVEPSKQITPVRLEKLMDPSKLASSKEKETPVTPPTVTNSRPQRRAAKKAESQIKEIVAQTESENPYGNFEDIEQLSEPLTQVCSRCSRLRQCKFVASMSSKTVYVCQESCLGVNTDKPTPFFKISSKLQHVNVQKTIPEAETINPKRKCSQCGLYNISEEKSLSWEAMDFCNEDCLCRYQTKNGSFCAYCKGAVLHASMGKYSVRFGLEARQFCSGSCLEEFKKGLKSCSYCQQNITKSTNIISAQIGEKGQKKDFCSQNCVEKFERMSSNLPLPILKDMCTVCAQKKNVEVQIQIQSKVHSLCSDVCFMAFQYANNINDTEQCHICKKYYEDHNPESHTVFHEDTLYTFCSKVCMNVFILFRRTIVPCSWCKVKKYNFDMIKKCSPGGNSIMMCSLNCLTLYQVSINAASTRKIKCDLCSTYAYAQYHLTMSDATIRNFCSYNCVMIFQTQYNKTPLTVHDHSKSTVVPVPLGGPKRAVYHQKNVVPQTNEVSRTSTIQKTATTVTNGLLPSFSASTATIKLSSPMTVATATGTNASTVINTTSAIPPPAPKYIQQIIVKPSEPKEVANKMTQCNPNTSTKEVSCVPEVESIETQTDEYLKHPAVVPIPVPIYVPVPMHMFTTPFPVPVPFALPIPVPIFIPTPKNTYKGVVQHMKEIVDKTPTNPFEADLLLMAKMVAGEDKIEETEEVTKNESGDDEDMSFADAAPDLSDGESFADAETSVANNFTDDVLQMALKMATEQLSNSPTVDLEAELTSNTITPQTQTEDSNATPEVPEVPVETKPPRTRKRTNKTSTDTPTRKRGRQQAPSQGDSDANASTSLSQTSSEMSSPPLTTEGERVDVNMCLKFTIGIKAWKQWVLAKNDQIEQAATAANKKAKTFNTNILKLTTDELNYLLCLFVKEVRKPNGMEYAPDTIYYLCLSIQQYLFENGRIDNIFTDSFYEPFTNALDEVAKKFSEVNDATQYIVTRVEEEHLWESKQLGAHSPHVLLATLMFFNTKYFNLATLEEHMQLSFSHIMKHWKRNPNVPIGKPGSPAPNRNVVLRFYPPQAALDAPNSRKKKVYEQHENEVNPLRCPVKLYEFYLSKCPESVKQRNDVFYLQPERSCVPDSPVWYSTMPLQKELLMKMLHRIRMVKEVNISLLAS